MVQCIVLRIYVRIDALYSWRKVRVRYDDVEFLFTTFPYTSEGPLVLL